MLPLSVMAADVQALRTLVQTQQSQLQSLQALQQAEPLVGLTTDSPWGMALEGVVLGLVALALGAVFVLGARAALPGRGIPRRTPRTQATPHTEFSDSLLYLADKDDAQDSTPAVTTQLHDPRQDAKASTLAHEDGDPELEYHRMALMAQGLSVTAGAGRVDSERIPMESTPHPAAEEKAGHSIFSPTLSRAEFDQRAATEEVERVRRYLAQRRADRAKAALPSAPLAPPPPVPVVPKGAAGADMALVVDIPLEVEPAPLDIDMGDLPPAAAMEHMDLSEGASFLVALAEPQALPPLDAGFASASAVALPSPAPDEVLLDWGSSSVFTEGGTPETLKPEAAADAAPMLGGAVQLALAQEFRDLGLWEEARARVLEILEQPDTGQHARARDLLDELAQTGAAPLTPQQDNPDPWH